MVVLVVAVVVVVYGTDVYWIIVYFLAPANTPANFSVDVINSTEIQVSWQQPPPPINGMIINYVLFVNSSGGLMTLNSTNSPLLITGLTPFTEYYISVAAETNGGRGPFTTPFPVTTNESCEFFGIPSCSFHMFVCLLLKMCLFYN